MESEAAAPANAANEETPRGRVTLPLRDLWFALIPLYGICYIAARRHYR